MKIQVIQVSRWPRSPLWVVMLVVVWTEMGWLCVGIGRYLGQTVKLCLFKNLTGIACPTCGFTRGFLSLMSGHVVHAWLYNPLLYSVLTIAAVWLAIRAMTGCTARVRLSRCERTVAWVAGAAMFLANWIYVITCIG
jgi:hypothetical protein